MMNVIKAIVLSGLIAVAACSPYTPAGRAVGGGLMGGAVGAGIAGLTGGDPATGAILGAGVGALGGALTTPQPHYRHR